MGPVNIMIVIVLVLAAALIGVAIWALREMVLTARSVRELSDDTRVRLVPLLDKTDVTVDAVNAELLRIDGIITRFEDASERVSSASGTISGIVSAPGDIVGEVADRMRRAWKVRRETSRAHSSEAPSPEDAAAPADDTDERFAADARYAPTDRPDFDIPASGGPGEPAADEQTA